jgi:hypothetical protein
MWKRIILGVFILMIFEGAIRKWILPWAQAEVYLVKDALLLVAYALFLLGSQPEWRFRGSAVLKGVIAFSFVFGCLEVLNPNSPSLLVGVAGVKDYFLYVPLAFILPYCFTSREEFLRFIKFYIVLAIPVSILGFVQVAAGPASFLNTYVSASEDIPAAIVKFGRHDNIVRTAGTFSFISGYTTYLGFMAFLAVGYNMARGWQIKNNTGPIIALALVIGAMFTTGSRGPVYVLAATAPVVFFWALISRILSPKVAARLFLLVPLIVFAALHVSPEAVEAFQYRAETSGDTYSRFFAPIAQLTEMLAESPFFGLGIGVTHNAALTIMGTLTPWWLNGMLAEEEIARVGQELGILGVVLIYFTRGIILVLAIRCTRGFRDPAYRSLGMVLTVQLAMGVVTALITNPTAGLYYWGSLGLILAMQRLERSGRLVGDRRLLSIRQAPNSILANAKAKNLMIYKRENLMIDKREMYPAAC